MKAEKLEPHAQRASRSVDGAANLRSKRKECVLEGFARRELPFLFVAGVEPESEPLRWRRKEGLSGDWLRGLVVRSWLEPF